MEHRTVDDGGRVEPGLLDQFPPGRLDRRFAGVDAAARRCPLHGAVEGVLPPQQQHAVLGVQAHDPRGRPAQSLHVW
jgi:hypothetical protein